MRKRMATPKRRTKTDARRWAARKNAQRGDPRNLSVDAFEIDRMRAYHRGRRPDRLVMDQMTRRWDSEFDRMCRRGAIECVEFGELDAVGGGE